MPKAIITAAITGGIHTPSMSEYLPVTLDQIADEAVRAGEAGAAVAHIHVRDDATGQPAAGPELFGKVAAKIKSRSDIILCITTGGGLGQTAEQRVSSVLALKPELASLNAGSLNFALFHALKSYKEFKYDWEAPYLAMTEDFIFPNTFKTMREFTEYFKGVGTKPEFEVYDVGMINNLAYAVQQGWTPEPVYLQFVMGILGGIPATVENLVFLLETARKNFKNFTWSVCAAGRHQFNMCTAAFLMGGNARVGLEDNLYLEKGKMAKSNAEQVEKIIRIGRELGVEPASPAEARQILGLKGLDKVAY